MAKRTGIRKIVMFSAAVGVAGVLYAGSAKAVISPEAANLLKIMQTNVPSDIVNALTNASADSSASTSANSSSGTMPQIIKSTYSDSSRSVKEMNFEKGDAVYVKIEIYDPNPQGENLVITDRVFNFKDYSFKGFKFTKSDGSTSDLSNPSRPPNNQIEFSVNVGKGNNRIEYEYKVEDKVED